MGNLDINVYDHNSRKAELPLLYEKDIPTNPSKPAKWHGDIHTSAPNSLSSVALSEQFDKSRLVAMHDAALHDSTVLEMGYQMTDCDEMSTILSEDNPLKEPSVGPSLRNLLNEDLKPISLRDLKVGKVHRGRVFSGTLCCRSVKTSVIMNVLEEDGTNDATRVVISNIIHSSVTTAKSQLLYPQGSKIAVQNPYLKRFVDGMVGLLIENPVDIVFTYLPKELQAPEENNSKEELASKQNRVGKDKLRHPRSDGQQSDGKTTEQAWIDTELNECIKKILSKEHMDVGAESRNSPCKTNGLEMSFTTQKKALGVGKKLPIEIISPIDMRKLKMEVLATPIAVEKNDLDSSIDFTGQLNYVLVEENGLQHCGELNPFSDDQILIELRQKKTLVPQKVTDTCAHTGPNGGTLDGLQIRHPGEEINISRDADAEQEQTEQTENPQVRLDHKAALHEVDKRTIHEDTTKETLETYVACAKLDFAGSLEKSTPKQEGSKDCSSQACENSDGKSIGKCEIIANTLKEGGGSSSPSRTTTAQKENLKGTLESSNADVSIADTHLTPSALRLLGNKHFAQRDWTKAIDLYTQATFRALQDSGQDTKENLSPNHDKLVGYGEPQKDFNFQPQGQEGEVVMDYSNRAEAWLRLHQYERAWADSQRALSVDPNHLKSLFRKGRALLGLGDYQQALAHFEAANARTPFDKDVIAAIKLTRIADHQNRLGIYDLTDYYLRGRFAGEVPNCADFIGPVQVKSNIGGKGRGLVLAKSVEAGDLLLVSNPLAFLQIQSQGKSKGDLNALVKGATPDESNPRMTAEIKEKLVQILLQRANVSGKNCQRLLSLCHGKEGLSHQSAPSMDLFVSGRPISPSTEPTDTEELDDIRLHQIVTQNAINRSMVSTTLERIHVFYGKTLEDTSNDNFVGLWVLPSFINHSCIPNVSMVVIGKCIFVYASRDLEVGEELQCSYFNVLQPLPQRRELASRWWAFSCTCARCLLEAKFGTSLERLQPLHTQIQPYPSHAMRFSPLANETLAKAIATELEILDASEKLGNIEKSWLQASFTQLYIISPDIYVGGNGSPLETALSALEIVSPSSTSALGVGLLCREYMGRDLKGKKTSKYKIFNKQLLRLCKCIFGKHRATVLQSLVEGIPSSMAVKV